jgi:hypothetical protein
MAVGLQGAVSVKVVVYLAVDDVELIKETLRRYRPV